MSRRNIIILLIVSILIVTGAVIAWIYGNSRTIIVHFDQVESAAFYDSEDSKITDVNQSGKPTRIFSAEAITIKYSGTEGYEDGVYEVGEQEDTVTLSPDFSQAGKNRYWSQHQPTISNLLNTRYPSIDRYSVKRTDTIERGRWIFILLQYEGDYGYNSDDLRMILEYTDNEWIVRADPDIIFTRYNTSDIDTYILKAANSL